MSLLVRESADAAELVRAGEYLIGSDPIRSRREREELSPDNLFYRHGRSQGFVALNDGSYVGRIVVSIDADGKDQTVGHFGYFDCVDDRETAAALFGAAENWLTANGRNEIHGPMNLSVVRGYRFQTAGFDRPAFPGEPRNPSYYPELVQSAGFEELHAWRSWDMAGSRLLFFRLTQLFRRHHVKRLRAAGYRAVDMNLREFERDLRTVHPLLMKSFAKNYGFNAIDLDEYVQTQKGLAGNEGVRAFYLVDPDGETVGFGFGYAYDQVFVFHTFAIDEGHRQKGLAHLMISHAFEIARDGGARTVIAALIKVGRNPHSRLGTAGRRYAIYRKRLDDAAMSDSSGCVRKMPDLGQFGIPLISSPRRTTHA